ncbi:MAG: SH3 domain-containing protein [Pseudomonadota bacterium]
MAIRQIFSALLIMCVATTSVAAADRGRVTNLPIPRYVSLKAAEGNVRRGPSMAHRIDWVFTHRGMPLRVTDEFDHWRRVEDRDGLGGWVHYSLLSGQRSVIIETDFTPMHAKPDDAAPVKAYAEAGVVARLGACGPKWCRVTAAKSSGWTDRANLWGLLPDEIRD